MGRWGEWEIIRTYYLPLATCYSQLFNNAPSPILHAQISKIAKLALYFSTICYIGKRVCYGIFMNDSSTKEEKPSYTKLAMRNMVQKGGTSLKHFALSAFGLLAVLIGLAYLTR